MPTRAPEVPTTVDLRASFPIDAGTELVIAQNRLDISTCLDFPDIATFAAIGYCALPSRMNAGSVEYEGDLVADLNQPQRGLATAHRLPPYKPRTDPQEYHGEETVDPRGAYMTIREAATTRGNVSLEIRYSEHLDRYVPMASFAWFGSRSVNDPEFMEEAALFDPTLPLGVKNGLDGNIESALEAVDMINKLRSEQDAPAVLVFRGGQNAQNPKAWTERYLEALQTTKGRMIVDCAHGSEMAFDPNENFEKSMVGQYRAMRAVIELANLDQRPAGIMIEASQLKSRTDPHIPISVALDGVVELHHLKTQSLSYNMS